MRRLLPNRSRPWVAWILVLGGVGACAAPPIQQHHDAAAGPDAQQGYCGDQAVGAGEGCDDGNLLDGDGCSPTCQVEPGWVCAGEPSLCTALCGNGALDPGEECEGSNLNSNDCTTLGAGYTSGTLTCLPSCRFDSTGCRLASCGNGVVDPGEACDDGNSSNEDACMNNCQAARCGDGYMWAGQEACDDGNTSNSDGCLNTCALATCGDGYVWTGQEACDDGNTSNSDGCLNTCSLATCGDGYVWAGQEACDDGNGSDTDACTAGCVAARCGDGHLWALQEACDDGNTLAGDGCSPSCAVEAIPTLHWATGQPAVWGSMALPWAGSPHAPSTPIVAAANVDQRGRALVFTATTYHALSLPGHQWIDSGSLNTRFPGVPGASVRAAWGVSWSTDTSSSVSLLTQEGVSGELLYLHAIDNTTGAVTPDVRNPLVIDLSTDPLAPDPANAKAAFQALSNPHGWTPYDPSGLCAGAGSAIGPHLGVVTSNNDLYLQDSGYCWLFYAQMPLAQFPPFTQPGAPQPAQIVAMFYTSAHGNRLYAITVP